MRTLDSDRRSRDSGYSLIPGIKRSILDAILRRSSGPPVKVIVGLGNPGLKYARTRHNIGFWCIDRLALDHDVRMSGNHRLALIGEGVIANHQVALVKPKTFVNRSGEAVRYLLTRYSLSPADIVVVVDDMALPIATLRLRPMGGPSGHNGLKSVIEEVGTQKFPRVRIGIGRPQDGNNISHVLSQMSKDQEAKVMEAVEKSARAIECLIAEGVETAMNQFN